MNWCNFLQDFCNCHVFHNSSISSSSCQLYKQYLPTTSGHIGLITLPRSHYLRLCQERPPLLAPSPSPPTSPHIHKLQLQACKLANRTKQLANVGNSPPANCTFETSQDAWLINSIIVLVFHIFFIPLLLLF